MSIKMWKKKKKWKIEHNNCWSFTGIHITSRSQRFEPDLVMAVRDLVRTVVAGEEVIGVLIPSTVTDLVSQRLQLVHVILRRRFPPKRSVRFTKIPYWDWIVKIVQIKFKLSDSRRKTTYYAEIGFFKELVVSWLPQSLFSTTLRKYIQYLFPF